MANSRLAARASFFAEVDVLSPSDAMPQRLWGKDLSEAGIFLQTTRPYHPGDRLSLRFDVPGSQVHVRAAEVVWVKAFEPINVDGALPGIGVRFLSVDPPARAAIRRYVQSEVATVEEEDVPAPPPSAELAESRALESLKPLSLPPFDTLAPRSALEEALEASGGEEWESMLHDAATLPPHHPALDALEDELAAAEDTHAEHSLAEHTLAEDTHAEHTLAEHTLAEGTPGEHALPDTDVEDTPREHAPPDTDLEETRVDVEHPLAGWRFEVVREEPPSPVPPPETKGERPRMVTLPPDSGLSLDESDGQGTGKKSFPPEGISLAPFELSGPHVPPRRLELSFDDEKHERGPDVLALAAHAKVDQDFFAGKLAVAELPQAEARGLDAQRTRRLRVAWAAGLLLAGGALGVAVGYEPAPEQAAKEPTLETRVTMLPAPKPVAEAEKELFAAPPAPVEKPAEKPSDSSNGPSVPFVSPTEVATSASGKLPRKEAAPAAKEAPPAPREDVSLTSATSSPSATKIAAESARGVQVEYGRVTIPLEGGRVARSFGLANPARVVVDLVDAKLPKERNEELGEKGVARVRFGRPDPVHVRVVVELAGADAPTGITTLKKGSSLAVAWR